ncbi:dihydroorotase [Actinopolymorpha pittospori]|uniref:Dihydroorotase (Multifunctional complex type) n=1 Tax=Actinopolymorpha pittospori TaxID=648752 RepID=A0A927N4X9_9ACTN|nr:amidohydrolase family protein [Actinopolymorpha pittospori]MBE1612174.1 dihydroorotase (multifunctional complex type) [Actinopolymorpha pittospori]
MPDADLLVAGGTVVTPAGRRRANIAVRDGRIGYVGTERPDAREVVDASGLLVLPGGVDTHVHLMDPGSPEREDFPTGTAAAATAGVTTIIEHSHGHPVRTTDDLRDKRAYLEGRSNVDYGLAAHAWPGRHAEVEPLWAAGVSFFKVFTCTTHGVPGHDAAALREHLRATSLVDAVTLMHCEDESLTESAADLLRGEGRVDGAVVPEWRSRDAELVAVAVAALLVRRTRARATVAHVSNPEVASYVARERAAGALIAAESCPQYFLLREDDVEEWGTLRKFTPPARARTGEDEARMWRLLRDGVLTHMSTDHAPSTLAQKAAGDIWEAQFGLPGLDSTMPLLLDAVARGHLAYEDVTRVYAEVPARTYGLWPRKGRIGVGADADLVLVDPGARSTLRNEAVISKAGWTPYDGREITGRVVHSYLRGEVVAAEGKPGDARGGRFLPGPGAPRASAG